MITGDALVNPWYESALRNEDDVSGYHYSDNWFDGPGGMRMAEDNVAPVTGTMAPED